MSELIQTIEFMGRTVVSWSAQLAVFIGFLWLVVRLDRRHRPEFRYRLWTSALVVSLFLPGALQGIASYSWTIRAKEVWTDAPASYLEHNEVSSKQPGPLVGTASRPDLDYPSNQIASSQLSSSAVVYRALGLLWALGIVAGALRRIRQHRKMRGIVGRATLSSTAGDSRLPILLSTEVSNPLLYGTFRPVILLPHDISHWSTQEEQATIIRHECIHFDKKHHRVAKLETLAMTVLFFHPFFRWMCTELDSERELVCDAEVLKRGVEPERYAETLLLVARKAISGHAGVHFAAKAQLNRRIDVLFRPPGGTWLALATVPIVLLTPLLTLGFWQTRAEAFEPIEKAWLTTLLPGVPKEAPEAIALTSTSKQLLPAVLPPQQANPTQPVGSGFFMVVSLFRKPDSRGSEVHVAFGIPHSSMVFSQNERFSRANGRVEMRIASVSGSVVARAEDPFELALPLSTPVPASSVAALERVFQLEPGAYSIYAMVTDSATGRSLGPVERRLEIPALPPTVHSASSLILADMVERGSLGNFFRLGDLRVRPNFTGRLRRDQELKLVQHVYNPSLGSLTYETLITSAGREVKRVREDLATVAELTVIKNFPLSDLQPGRYEVETLVTDSSTNLKVGARTQFSVE